MNRKLMLVGALALGLAASRTFADDCKLAHADAKKGTVDVPCHDEAKMKELQGLDGATKPKVSIQWPKMDETIESGDKKIEYMLEGYKIGKGPAAEDWQHCHLILDDKPYEADYDHTTTLEALNDKKPLEEGTHVLTIFPARNFHLSLKSEGACAQVRFNVKKASKSVVDLKAPQLVYSRPKGKYSIASGQNKDILCDFYLLNVPVDKDQNMTGHQVKITVEGPGAAETHTVTRWWPVMIMKDAKAGDYKVTTELLDKSGKPVEGRQTKTTRKVTVE